MVDEIFSMSKSVQKALIRNNSESKILQMKVKQLEREKKQLVRKINEELSIARCYIRKHYTKISEPAPKSRRIYIQK